MGYLDGNLSLDKTLTLNVNVSSDNSPHIWKSGEEKSITDGKYCITASRIPVDGSTGMLRAAGYKVFTGPYWRVNSEVQPTKVTVANLKLGSGVVFTTPNTGIALGFDLDKNFKLKLNLHVVKHENPEAPKP